MSDLLQIESAFVTALEVVLPLEHYPHVPLLAKTLAHVANGRLSAEAAGAQLTDPSLAQLLLALAGREVRTPGAVLAFSGNDQRGATITISGDIAGGSILKNNVITLTIPITIQYYVPQPNPPGYYAPRPAGSLDRNRSPMIEKVRHIWITGLLEHTFSHEAHLALKLVEQPEAVTLALNVLVQELQHLPQSLHPGTPIIDVFTAMNGTLLILGAPGAGKTTLLLELARDLLDRSRADETHPIPVVFNLSSWAARRAPLAMWLADELNARYDVARKVGQAWIKDNQVLPLLDGLDEVRHEDRMACVMAINIFRQEHGFVPIAVCSRTEDYAALTERLHLSGAVLVQPLTTMQIDTYLDQVGAPLAGLRQALHLNPALRELAETPLMLSVMAVAYQGQSADVVSIAASVEEQQQQLWDIYITRMLTRRRKDTRFAQRQTLTWLGWLANTMQRHNQTIFYLEHMQPIWLPRNRWRTYYTLIAVLLGGVLGGVIGVGSQMNFGLLLGFSIALGLALSGEHRMVPEVQWALQRRLSWGVVIGLIVSVGLGLLIWSDSPFGGATTLMIVANAGLLSCLTFIITHSWTRRWTTPLRVGISVGGSVGAGVSLCVTLLVWMVNQIAINASVYEKLIVGPMFGLIAGVLMGLAAGIVARVGGDIHPIASLRWSWKQARLAALLAGGSIGLIVALLISKTHGLVWGIHVGIWCGLVAGLVGRDIEQSNAPNQGIWRSARIVLWGTVIGVLVWMEVSISSIGPESVQMSAQTAQRAGLFVGTLWALSGGLVACCQHLLLRLMLCRDGAIPSTYVPFLDYAAERILLRKIGGGYIFIHRALLEYFAQQNPNSTVTTQSSAPSLIQPTR